MKVLASLSAAFLFAASTQTSQAMPCGQYKQLLESTMNNPNILPMQKECYVAIAEYTCEECNGDMACMERRGQMGREESARIMPQLPECDDLMNLARGFMPKRQLRSHHMPAEVSCDAASLGRMVDAQLPPVTDPAQVIAQGMQKRCFVGIAMDMCEPCDGDTACMQARGKQGGRALMMSTPECAELMQVARGFMPKRRLKYALRRLKAKKDLNKRLFAAVRDCNVRSAKSLLSRGANVNAYEPDSEGDDKPTVLLVAIKECKRNSDTKVKMVEMLLRSNADPNKRSSEYRYSPLLYTVWYDLLAEVAKVLLADPRTNPNLENYKGTTPLKLAISNGFNRHALLFAQDPRTRMNHAGKDGETLLGAAYCWRREDMIAIVQKYGGTKCKGCSLCP